MRSTKNRGRASSLSSGLGVGILTCIAVTAICAAILAELVNREILPWEKMGYGIMILIFLSSFLGSATACGKIKRQWMLTSLMTGMLYWGVMLGITALFFGGHYEAVEVTALLILAGSGTAGLIRCMASLQRDRRIRRKNPYR